MTYFDFTDDYIAGNLSAEERARFEDNLKTSPELRAELALSRRIHDALRAGEPDPAHQAFVNEIHQEHFTEQQDLIEKYHTQKASDDERARFRKRLEKDELFAFEVKLYREKVGWRAKSLTLPKGMQWAAAAAAVMVLVVAGWWFWQLPGQQNLPQMAARFDPPDLRPTSAIALDDGLTHRSISGSGDFNELKSKGLQAYDASNWDEAIRLLSEYARIAKPSAEELPDEINLAYLFIGRAWLEKNKPDRAVVALQTAETGVVDTVNYGMIRELMRWQLALANLKNNDKSAALATLERLKNAEHEEIRAQADKLREELR